MSVSLLHVKHRDSESLLHSVKNVRISTFYTPSSFYLQLLEENELYNKLKNEMLSYYNGATKRSFRCALSRQTPDKPILNKLKIKNLKVSMQDFIII